MKSLDNNEELEGDNVGMMSLPIKGDPLIDGGSKVIGGVVLAGCGFLTYLAGVSAGYLAMSAGFALYMNGREMVQESENEENAPKKIIAPYNESYISSINEDEPNSGFAKSY